LQFCLKTLSDLTTFSHIPFFQVCVSQCPEKTFSGFALASQGQDTIAKSMMKTYCGPITEERWNRKSASDLIKQGSMLSI
jgi:hypothetical protein